MRLSLLLVNPNQTKTPPVIPIGLEYLKSALDKHDYESAILDLCFSSNPLEDLRVELDKKKYDLVGFTIRNVDSCIFFNNEFFLPKIKDLVDLVKKLGHPVILGGAGFSAMPKQILEYLGADYGIIGPGEKALIQFLNHYKENEMGEKIIDGWDYGLEKHLIPKRASLIDYSKYMSEDGIVGFQTHSGCDGKCPYCMESNTKLYFRNIPDIIQEITNIVNQGFNHFHLCDCEFNNVLDYSIKFCKELIKKCLPMKWTLYMKPVPYNEELYSLLSQSNAYLITLTVDSEESIQKMNNYSYEDLKNIILYCNKYNIDLAIDLLVGYPNETLESVDKMIQFFKKYRPSKVGISFYYRVFDNTPLGRLVKNDLYLKTKLTRALAPGDGCLEPVFFNQINLDQIQKLIGDDPIFHIAGKMLGVNYQL